MPLLYGEEVIRRFVAARMAWLRSMPRHLRSMRPGIYRRFEIWQWELSPRIFYHGASHFHFERMGVTLDIGPFGIGVIVNDSN